LGGGGGSSTWSGITNTVNTGSAGTVGIYTAGTGTVQSPFYVSSSSPYSNVYGSDITIQYNNETIHVGKTLKMLMDRLCVIEPNFKLMEKYPALKEAYDNYKLLEALLANEDDTKDE
jgi:hypothetical protein